MIVLSVLLTCIRLIAASSLVHFYSEAGHKRCFYKELNEGAVLFGKYKIDVQAQESEPFYTPFDKLNTGALIDVHEQFGSKKRLVHIKGSPAGQFTFTILLSGEHMICLTPKSFYRKKWSGGGSDDPRIIKESKFIRARVLLDLDIGDIHMLDTKSNHKGQVKRLNERINKLNDKLMDIKREQLFIREKEEGFRNLSESTNETVVNWMIAQVCIMFLVGVYQLLTFQRFFVKAKIS